ncbi:ATP-dependent helicase/nuclease subunit A [Pseudovibrio axinellae]|uniref:DNA 3'-5' helicase n=1 Tax=Pseudovibrio axinellae TaxID=989403 RepID=A0A165Z095_9HYPH|nr:double-strand break repair helicase AddA [Pseudovibrio axinellae]KZL19393.1 ATP-dependent helicase/nuclease subunit A [Pseudovibrio axinellae]SEQ38231.1 DNA helicase/exodeoxyribonuclease V, subunit A [Pseudovibrio axinellae]
MDIPAKTLDSQQRAAHPQNSAWVSANAGSGKTFVLARRVVRLLLSGTDPARILCLTFTKAAAAEMATRVFDSLAKWTQLTDAELAAEIEDIEGRPTSPGQLANARRLFAKALETPGGLKIQTIHAFCEALLHQFPLEANVAGHFSVLDDRLADELLNEARASVLHSAEIEADSEIGSALSRLIELLPDAGVEKALSELISRRDAFYRWVAPYGDLESAISALYADFSVAASYDISEFASSLRRNSSLSADEVKAFAEALRVGSKTDQDRAAALDATTTLKSDEAWRIAWMKIFLTGTLGPRKSLATKKVQTAFPEVVDRLFAEQTRVLEALNHQNAVITVSGTKAILTLSDAVLRYYETEKLRRGYLDFEDLVVKSAQLLSRAEAAQWVQYKLDQGLDHILVDEAQDTSPRQWEVIRALAEEFFAGDGAREKLRTIFAVGDEKQSIYSFQGAVPAYFAQMRKFFAGKAAQAQKNFEGIELNLSFRSTPDVLGAVDKVFDTPETFKGLSQDNVAPVHEAIRHNDPGRVEIWPLEEAVETLEPDDWTQPIDAIGTGNPMLRLATRIAEQIKDWDQRKIAGPGDVLVLVRKRGAFVEALNRELKRLDVPAAGSDRLVLTDHIAVKDLVALGRFILLPEDDLSLACVLKSPLFGLLDDDLFEIAHETPGVPRPGTLWHELLRKSEKTEKWQVVRKQLEAWRDRADFVPPFEFYARIMGTDGYRQKFRERLGTEVDDVLDEFLSLTLTYEKSGTPGLEGFLAWLAEAPTEIKRELNAAKGMVRIMTVHGSKGLEAPYVILADGCNAPVSSQHSPVMVEKQRAGDSDAAPALVWLPNKVNRTDWHDEALDLLAEEQKEEYRRLLYVALTRAKDRLVVCGWSPKRGPHDECWYTLTRNGLIEEAREQKDGNGEVSAWIWTKGGIEKPEPVLPRPEQVTLQQQAVMPDWVSSKVSTPERMRQLKPSAALEEMEAKESVEQQDPKDQLEVARQPEDWPLVRGRLVHRLLEFLPELAEDQRSASVERFLAAALPERFADRKERLLKDVFSTLNNPEFAELFSTDGRAEVPIQGVLTGEDGKPVEIYGLIDRLLVNDEEVIILDLKTNAIVPHNAREVSENYVAQLAIYRKLLSELYPERTIRALLLYTSGPRLIEIPVELMKSFKF